MVTGVNRGVQTTGIFPDILMIWEDSPSCALGRFTFSVWGQNRKLGLRETFETGPNAYRGHCEEELPWDTPATEPTEAELEIERDMQGEW